MDAYQKNQKEKPTVYFSNRLESLAEALGETLFKKGQDPFCKRVVLLPNHSLKLYLSSFFARHPKWNISAGVEYKTLLEGTITLLRGEKEERFLSQMGISYIVEGEITKILQGTEDDGLFCELKRYLGKDDFKKIIWTAQELARLFYEYGVFEPKALEKWLLEKGWKQELWKRIFSSDGKWRSLSAALLEVPLGKKERESTVHLFGFTYLPSHFYDFFCRSKAYFYFLSPSEMFWEDLCSDLDRIYLEKKMIGKKIRLEVQEQMSLLIKQTHPLLANWGRAGKALLSRFGETECYLEEEYVSPLAETVLSYVQRSLLDLKDDFEQREISLEDTSLLCLSASSKLREVEILLETLKELMHESSIEPKDVLVLSGNLEGYLPYIHTVFGQKSSPFSYSIHGISSSSFSEQVKAVEFLLSFGEKRFDRDILFQFLSFPSVMKKWEFTPKDLLLLKSLAEKANVLWGICPEHKEKCLKNAWPEEVAEFNLPFEGTWKEGIDRLVLGLAMDLDISLVSLVEWTEAELLGRFIHILHSLKEDLKPIYEKEKKSFKAWAILLEKWLSTYFISSSTIESLLKDVYSLEEEIEGSSSFEMPFMSFKRALDSHFQRKKESFQSSHLNAVKFLSLEMDGIYPSKIICVLGLDEESFPKKELPSCFGETSLIKEIPSSADQSRYLFLQLILHARNSLILSYQRFSTKDQKSQGPSRLIEELLSYIDAQSFFSQSEKKPSEVFTRHHPAMSFSKSYFQEESFCKNSSTLHLAESYYVKEKKQSAPFFVSWQEKKERASLVDFSKIIEIKKIQDFAKNPVRFYFKEVLGVFFDFESSQDKEFFLSPVTKSRIKNLALAGSLDEATFLAKARGELPLGEIGKIGVADLTEELQEWKEGLSFFGLKEEDLFHVEFSDSARHIEKKNKRIICPSLILEIEGMGSIAIQGNLYPVSSKGFLWTGKKKKDDYPLLWPSFLIFMCVAEDLGLEKECLLLNEKKKLSIYVEDPRLLLSKYLKLYVRSLEEPCPVRPEWLSTLLSKSKGDLQKKITPSSYDIGFVDPYDEWIEKRDPTISADHVLEEWKMQWSEVFSLLIEEEKGEVDVDI